MTPVIIGKGRWRSNRSSWETDGYYVKCGDKVANALTEEEATHLFLCMIVNPERGATHVYWEGPSKDWIEVTKDKPNE